MFRLLNRRFFGVLLLATALAGCDDEPGPTTPTPSEPKTDTFSGTVTPNGAATHNFATAGSGAVTATLRAIGGDNSLVVGLSLGNWNTTTSVCTILLANDAATGGSVVSGTMTGIGSLCVRVYDVGNIPTGGAAYTVEVVHP
jgi:hypothetical protein